MRPIQTIDKIVRTRRQMLKRDRPRVNAGEIADKLDMPPEKVRKVFKITGEPILLENPYE